MFRSIALLLTLIALPMVLPAQSASVMDSVIRDRLTSFYHAMDGDQWHRSDGWLDPGVSVCDWYGVHCSGNAVTGLVLPDNNLSGRLDQTDILDLPSHDLVLADNAISGPLLLLPISTDRVDLSNNRLDGPLPDTYQDGRQELWYLNLSGNDFSGEVPKGWPVTVWMDLSDNRLQGLPTQLFRDLPWAHATRYLNLAGNRFSGELPAWIMDAPFDAGSDYLRWGGSLNLCWNDFEVNDPALADWIAERHVGGPEFESCLNTERRRISPAVSGSWFDPARSGEGIVAHQLDNDRALVYWFTFDDQGEQRWLHGVGRVEESALVWPEVWDSHGHFGQPPAEGNDNPSGDQRGSIRLDRIGEHSAVVERVYVDPLYHICILPYPPVLACFGGSVSDRLTYFQFTRLAGSTCHNRQPNQWISGAWFNPAYDSEGFIVDVTEHGHGVVYWFTHAPDDSGRQVWMMGDGSFDGSTLTIDNLVMPQGASFGRDFDSGQVRYESWGSLTLEFENELGGTASFESQMEEFGSGQFPIQRLARPKLAECD